MDSSSIHQTQGNSLINQANISGLSQRVLQGIKNAAAQTGVDFAYLLNKAAQESGFDPNAKAASSSATGLYQFTNQTWLSMVKNNGAKYGLSDYADHISVDSSGTYHVNNPIWKQATLDLRKDPQVSAEMAGELDKQNLDSLKENVGGKIGATELYLAHFLGAGGASDFIKTMRSNPNASAANVLPEAADANPSVFYDADGNERSLKQIYQHFAQRFDGGSSVTATMIASAGATSSPTPSSYANASAAYATASSTYVPSVIGKSDASTQSTYEAMVMAQMNMGDMSSAILGDSNRDTQHKKDALAMLSSIT